MLSMVQHALGLRARRPGQSGTDPDRTHRPDPTPNGHPVPDSPGRTPASSARDLLAAWNVEQPGDAVTVPVSRWVAAVAGEFSPYATEPAVRLAKALVRTGEPLSGLWVRVRPQDMLEALQVARDGEVTEPGAYVGRLSFPDWVAEQARRYRSLGTDAGDLVADSIDELVREITILQARTPDQVYDRRAAYPRA